MSNRLRLDLTDARYFFPPFLAFGLAFGLAFAFGFAFGAAFFAVFVLQHGFPVIVLLVLQAISNLPV